ncbi:ADP-ribosylation factor 1-like 1 [Eumeta japonica]|uniref:ADP-ribosylation factor 1-like 1 n=1 Tax=Eumeta variegata TaxID=151549 RepID=A0A4C1TTK5_EUMVA|nr:ADP-ribosylation factor 1-like 1 [Eumeta japonica]
MEDYNENNIKVLCLGPKGSGKTTLLKKLQDVEEIDNTYSPVPTMGTNIFTVRYQNKTGRKQTLLVREIGGDMASLWTNYLDGIEKVLFVVDTSNLCQISAAAVLLYTLLADPRLQDAKFIVVLSKMDAAYRQMRNEALLMLQMTRLRKELRGRQPPPPAVLEASALSAPAESAAQATNITSLYKMKRSSPRIDPYGTPRTTAEEMDTEPLPLRTSTN